MEYQSLLASVKSRTPTCGAGDECPAFTHTVIVHYQHMGIRIFLAGSYFA
jgi:hypothetical protein